MERDRESARHPIIVTIDGPAGAGKSTVAKRLARALGYELLDTGALYRAVALLACKRGIAWTDETALADITKNLEVSFRFADDVNHVLVKGIDITADIRSPEISVGASTVSALPGVRAALLELQRQLGERGGVVVEGRDTGTVVFPNAHAKFFLTASDDVRARRRHEELQDAGAVASYDETLRDLRDRDERDSLRAVAPLQQAEDAIWVDSSGLALDDVVITMLEVVRRREIEVAGAG